TYLFFFFQAEDGIRDFHVTGVQTCALPIYVANENYYALEEPTSLNTLELLPKLMQMGVRAIKIEGRQRSPAYVAQVTRVWRDAKIGRASCRERVSNRGDGVARTDTDNHRST